MTSWFSLRCSCSTFFCKNWWSHDPCYILTRLGHSSSGGYIGARIENFYVQYETQASTLVLLFISLFTSVFARQGSEKQKRKGLLLIRRERVKKDQNIVTLEFFVIIILHKECICRTNKLKCDT